MYVELCISEIGMRMCICALQKTHVTLVSKERECRWTRRALLVSLEVVCTCLAHRQGGEYSVRHANTLACARTLPV